MAILKSVVQVNNGNTGWTKTNVLNALEQTFTNLGFHGGSQVNGVACTTLPPGSTIPYNNGTNNSNWRFCGGGEAGGNASYYVPLNYRYSVTASGTSAYVMQQYVSCSNVNYSYTDAFHFPGEILPIGTGTPVVFNSQTTVNITGGTLVNGTTYYTINDAGNRFRLATTQANATAGTAIDITSSHSSGTFTFTIGSPLTNPNLTFNQGDIITFDINATGHPFFITDTAGAYNSERVLDSSNYRSSNYVSYRNLPTGQGNTLGTLSFNTGGWRQGNYYYVCGYHSTMAGTITLLPNTYTSVDDINVGLPYWDYTVPASGSRSALSLRVYRASGNLSYTKSIAGIKVLSTDTSGWSNNEVFTIPGDQIGGTTPASDVVFGVNSSTTPSISVTNLGAGTNFYQKFTNQSKAILKIVNDPAKTYGTTYYGFAFNTANDYELTIQSGSSWEHLNYDPNSSTASYSGRFGGINGLDWSTSLSRQFVYGESYTRTYATSSTPTAYPLKIVTYRAQAPQDTNFAIIQFVQTINAVDLPYFTFFLHKGTNYGAGIWDLNHVWQGGMSEIYPTTSGQGESIGINTYGPGRYGTKENSSSTESVRRESLFGYLRDADDAAQDYATMLIKNNLYTDNILTSAYYSYVTPATAIPYYRNSQYDKSTFSIPNSYGGNLKDYVTTYTVSSSANFYKPLKGIPLNSMFAPCPYYLPDDFVTIPFVVSPGLTQFRPGDTITVSPSEIYEIITASYSTNQTTFDNVPNNTSKGIAFCARTT